MLNLSKKYFGEKQLDEATEVTNKFFGNKESEDHINAISDSQMEIDDDDKATNEHPSTLIDCSGDQECEPKKEDQATAVSIDVTKALLLLGINCWSNLEPGKRINRRNLTFFDF